MNDTDTESPEPADGGEAGSGNGGGSTSRSRSVKVLWVVGIFAALFLLWPQIEYRFSAPLRVGGFFHEITNNQGEQAWEYLSEEDREEFSREEFAGLVDLFLISVSGGGADAAAVRSVAGREGAEQLGEVLRKRTSLKGIDQQLEGDRGEVIITLETVDTSDLLKRGLQSAFESLLEGKLEAPGSEELTEWAREAPLTQRDVGIPVVWQNETWYIKLPGSFKNLRPLLELYGDP